MKNRRKNKNKILIFFITIIFLACQNRLVYAIDYSSGEFRPRPSDSGGGTVVIDPPPDDTSATPKDTVTHDYVAGIGGNVTEIIEAINEQVLGNKGTDSSGITTGKGVKNIYVEADNGSTTRTNENGEYYFPLSAGETINKITFKYGYLDDAYIENTTVNNYKERQEILKYNGQDYAVVADEYINTIELSQKGCAQVYLVLDCSVSMEEYITLSDGSQKTKLQIEKDIATNIINELLDGSKNVYVGLVVFTGEVYRKTSLTNDRNLLLEAINGEIEFNDKYYTNIKGALEKAYNSYANNIKETSNRYMFLLSDGLPTSDGNEEHTLYTATTQQEINENNNKLQYIATNTKDTVQKILQEGVKLYSVFTMDGLEETDEQLINFIFNDFEAYSEYNTFKPVDTIENVSDEIIEEFAQYVKESVQVTSTGYRTNKNYREDILSENYASFRYNNTSYFQALDMEVTADNLDQFKQYLRKLVDEATVTVELQTSATGQTPISAYDVTENITNSAGEIIGTRTIHHVPNPITVKGPTLTLQQIPEFTLNPTVTLTGFEVIAQNGSIIDSLETTVEEKSHLIATVEESMLHGSEVRVYYTIEIINTSIYDDSENIQIICYLPDDFTYRNGTAIGLGMENPIELGIKNENVVHIDKNNVENLAGLTQEIKNYINKGHNAIAISVDVNQNNFQLLTNGSIQIKIMASRLLSARLGGMQYGAAAEIFGYENESCRRILYKATSNNPLSSQQLGLKGEVAANRDTAEADYAESPNSGIILTPTGEDRRMYVIVCITVLLGLVGIQIKNKIKR